MTEIGYVGPKVAIFDSRGTLLHESTDIKGFADRSLKYIIGSLRKVQRETNQFLTKLVNEQNPQNTCQNETDAVEDSADEDDGDDESACPKKRNGSRFH